MNLCTTSDSAPKMPKFAVANTFKLQKKTSICTCCHQCINSRRVIFNKNNYNFENDVIAEALSMKYRFHSKIGQEWICKTCHNNLKINERTEPKMPRYAVAVMKANKSLRRKVKLQKSDGDIHQEINLPKRRKPGESYSTDVVTSINIMPCISVTSNHDTANETDDNDVVESEKIITIDSDGSENVDSDENEICLSQVCDNGDGGDNDLHSSQASSASTSCESRISKHGEFLVCTCCHRELFIRKHCVIFNQMKYDFNNVIVKKTLCQQYRYCAPESMEYICNTCHNSLRAEEPKMP